MKFWNWLKCRLPRWIGGGHLRGKATGEIRSGLMKVYRCPRCGAEWSRKITEKGAA